MRWLLAILAACGSSRAPAPTPAPIPPRVAPTTQTCPTAFAAARGACQASVRCTYPEGSCVCAPQVSRDCPGGAAMRPDPNPPPPSPPPPPPPLLWQCTPTVRADGCPGESPEGTTAACTTPGKECTYGDCCFHQFTCKDGTWQLTGGGCPP